MSTKDISRFLFQPRKHYVGMRMQQGRVSLDSDHNEGAWHDDEDQRETLLELIGPQGSPDGGFFIGYTSNDGIGGTPQPITVGVNPGVTEVTIDGVDQNVPNLYIMPGAMYVGGLRVEMEEPEHIAFQSDYLQNTFATDIPSDLSSSATVRRQFFFLNVWEQCVTAIEDEEFLERALGGPDTSVRVRRMRRVEYLLANEGEDCRTALIRALEEIHDGFGEFVPETGELKSLGRLWIDFAGGDTEDTCAPCHPDPTGRYLGAENQAIRIMLADSGHFVWAYDNASPLYRVTVSGVSDTITEDPLVTMLTQPKDVEHWPLANRVVEILPWSAILENGEKVADEIGVFCRVSRPFTPDGNIEPPGEPPKTFRINRNDTDAMAALNELIHAWDDQHPRLPDLGDGSDPRHFYVRFWHEVSLPSTPILIPIDSGLPLGTTGVVPNFTANGMRGDFWTAALRPETPDRTVPFDLHRNTAGVPPHGPRHFYAPLALIQSADNQVTGVEDCRKHIVPVTDQECCTVIVGDGVHSVGQFTSIQAAIDSLPPEGGRVCIRPGLYRQEFSLVHRVGVTISGCGEATVLESPETPTADAVVNVVTGREFVIESLKVRASGQKAIYVNGTHNARLSNLDVEAGPIVEGQPLDDTPLVHMQSNGKPSIDTLRIIASRRTGLIVDSAGHTTRNGSTTLDAIHLKGVTIQGAFDGTLADPPAGPLAVVRSGGHFVLEDWHLDAFGQIGLQIDTCRLELRRAQIVSRGFSVASQAKSALDIRDGSYEISDCRFQLGSGSLGSEYAAVVLHGAVLFERNLVVTDADGHHAFIGLSWGGIQVRGDSAPVTIRNNVIRGGAGHGITLGSVLWYRFGTDPTLATRREGAGRVIMNPATGQVNGSLRSGFTDPVDGFLYLPRVEAKILDIEITDNIIEQMGTNGISVLTLFGLLVQDPFIALDGTCRILDNRIVRNIRNPSSQIPLAEPLLPIGGSRLGALAGHGMPMRMLPLGGIVLGTSTLSSIGGSPPTDRPVGLDIRGNIVEDNGTDENARTLPISGIVVLTGDAMTIADNRVARNGVATQSADVLQTGLRAGIAVLLAGSIEGTRDGIGSFLNDVVFRSFNSFSLKLFGNNVEQFEGRALFVAGTGPMSIENNFFSSTGFHGSIASPEALAEITAIGDVVYVHNLGRPWEGLNLPGGGDPLAGVPPNNQQIKEGTFSYIKDLPGYGVEDVFFVGIGGHTLFANNQVIYAWDVQQVGSEPLSYAPVALVSLDHMSVRNNQLALMLQTGAVTLPTPPLPPPTGTEGFGGRPILSHLLVVAFSVDCAGNRVSEGVNECEASIHTLGFSVNSTTNNLGTHCIAVVLNPAQTTGAGYLNSGNMSIISPTTSGCNGIQGVLFGFSDDYILLLADRR